MGRPLLPIGTTGGLMVTADLEIWFAPEGLPAGAAADLAAHFGTATSRLTLATGIANIYHRHPGAMLQGANTVAEQTGGRFVLGPACPALTSLPPVAGWTAAGR